MSFKEIIGHQGQIEQIKSAVRNNKVPHAYLFAGPEGVGKKKIAYEFIKYLNCENPDTEDILSCERCLSCLRMSSNSQPDQFEINEQEGSIKIEQVRNLTAELSLKNILTKYKCVIINNCELLTTEAANSLLKIIEEPTENTIFFLITSNESKVLPTIISRAQKISFQQLSQKELFDLAERKNLFKENLDFLTEYSQGSFSRLLELAEDDELLEELREYKMIIKNLCDRPYFEILNLAKIFEKEKKKLQRFLDFIIFSLEKTIRKREIEKSEDVFDDLQPYQVKQIIDEVVATQKMLLRNINSRFVGEMLLIKMKSILKG